MSPVNLPQIGGAFDRALEPGAAPTSSPHSLLVGSVRLEETLQIILMYTVLSSTLTTARYRSACWLKILKPWRGPGIFH